MRGPGIQLSAAMAFVPVTGTNGTGFVRGIQRMHGHRGSCSFTPVFPKTPQRHVQPAATLAFPLDGTQRPPLVAQAFCGPQGGALQAEGGDEFEFKWTCTSTSRKYHLVNYRCAASRRVDPELWMYGNQALSKEWTLCKLCEAQRRKTSCSIASSAVSEKLDSVDEAEPESVVGPGPTVSKTAWTGGSTAAGGAVNVVDPLQFSPNGALRVLWEEGWFCRRSR